LSGKITNGRHFGRDAGWTNGFPEVLIPVVMASDTRADFRLVLERGEGQAPEYTPIGTLLGIDMPEKGANATELRDIHSTLKIGTSGREEMSGRARFHFSTNNDSMEVEVPEEPGITGLLDFTGRGATLALESGLNEWVFKPEKIHLHLNDPERITFGIATRKARGKNGEEITETLRLEVNVSKH
jgi:hypothetical protein